MRLYDIKQEFIALNELLENDYDPETGEVYNNEALIKSMFNELALTLSDKLESAAYTVQSLELQSKALKDEAKRLADRAKRLENNADYLKSIMLSALIELPDQKLKTTKFNFSTRKSEQVIIEEGFNMKGKYVRVKETREPDKTAIKEAIKNGELVIGVTLVTNQSLTIK